MERSLDEWQEIFDKLIPIEESNNQHLTTLVYVVDGFEVNAIYYGVGLIEVNINDDFTFPGFTDGLIDYTEQGWIDKYIITKTNGKPVDPLAEYFVLRLDEYQKSEEHLFACIVAVNAYADAIDHYLPELAKDIRKRYPL